MSVIPCNNKIGCESDYPLTNYSAEDPDPRTFLGYSTGTAPTSSFPRNTGGGGPKDGGPDRDDTGDGPAGTAGTGTGGAPPPLGSTWDNPVITTFSESTESQAQAHDDAGNENVSRMTTSSDTGEDAGGIVLSNGLRPSVFGNDPQQCSLMCPDGQLFTYTVPANKFRQLSKAKANKAALSEACKQAQLNAVCLGPLDPTAVVDVFYDSTIIAFAANVPITFTIISGDIPTWADATVDVNQGRVRIFGTPQSGDVGDTTFTLEAVDVFGNTMTRSYTITVSAGAACDPTATPAISSFTVDAWTSVFCDKTGTIFSVDSAGTSILEISTSGVVLNAIFIGFGISCLFYENTNQRLYVGYATAPGVPRVTSYNPTTRAVVNTTVLTVFLGSPATPKIMTYDPTRNKLWTHDGAQFVWSLNANTFSQTVVDVDAASSSGFISPSGMVYCIDQDKILMFGKIPPNSLGISVWNPATMAFSFIDAGQTPNGDEMCYNANNGLAYGINTDPGQGKVLVIDPGIPSGFNSIDLTSATIAWAIGYNPCTDRVVAIGEVAAGVSKAYYIDPASDTILTTLTPGAVINSSPNPLTYDAADARLWMGTGDNLLLKFT